jgi:hypothetical protein
MKKYCAGSYSVKEHAKIAKEQKEKALALAKYQAEKAEFEVEQIKELIHDCAALTDLRSEYPLPNELWLKIGDYAGVDMTGNLDLI